MLQEVELKELNILGEVHILMMKRDASWRILNLNVAIMLQIKYYILLKQSLIGQMIMDFIICQEMYLNGQTLIMKNQQVILLLE